METRAHKEPIGAEVGLPDDSWQVEQKTSIFEHTIERIALCNVKTLGKIFVIQ